MDSEEVDPDSPEEPFNPDAPLPACVLEEDIPEIQEIHAAWKACDLPLDEAHPDPETRPTDPRWADLYDTVFNGQMIVHEQTASLAHVEFYRLSDRFTATDIRRWYCNSPEGRLIGDLIGDANRDNLRFALKWMRRFNKAVSRDRASSRSAKPGEYAKVLYRTLARLDVVRRVISIDCETYKTFTPEQLRRPRKFLRKLNNSGMSSALLNYRNRVRGDIKWVKILCSDSVERASAQAKFDHAVETVKQQFLAGTFEQWTPCTKREDGRPQVDWSPDAMNRFVVTMVGACEAGHRDINDPYLDTLLSGIPSVWVQAALRTTSSGWLFFRKFSRTVEHFQDCPASRGLVREMHSYFYDLFRIRFDEARWDMHLHDTNTEIASFKVDAHSQVAVWQNF